MADPSASAPPSGASYPPQQQYPQATYPDGAPQQQPPPAGYGAPPAPDAAAYPPQPAAPYPDQAQQAPQAAYPPQQAPQAAYPPQQAPQAAYPPQQAPQAAYPPQQQPYPQTQQPGYSSNPYPQQGAAPPPYYPEQQVQQQVETKVVVETQQPTVYVAPQRSYGTGDHGLVYAIIATVATLFCCFYFGLACTIPAIFLAISAQDASSRGNEAHARSQTQISYVLSSVAVGSLVVLWLIVIISAAVR